MKITVLITLLGILLSNCSTTRDNKAIARVISNPKLTEKIGRIWEKSNPCIPDTPIYISGKTITVIDSTAQDSQIIALNMAIDSLVYREVKKDTIIITKHIVDSLKLILKNQILKDCKPRLIFKTRVDTITKKDLRSYNLVFQDLNILKGQYTEKDKQFQDEKKSSKKKDWYIAGLIALFGLGLFLKIKRII